MVTLRREQMGSSPSSSIPLDETAVSEKSFPFGSGLFSILLDESRSTFPMEFGIFLSKPRKEIVRYYLI